MSEMISTTINASTVILRVKPNAGRSELPLIDRVLFQQDNNSAPILVPFKNKSPQVYDLQAFMFLNCGGAGNRTRVRDDEPASFYMLSYPICSYLKGRRATRQSSDQAG